MIKMKYFLTVFSLVLFCEITHAHPSYGIVVDKFKNIYFADLEHNGDGTVWKLSKDGELTAIFKDFHCHNIMLDKDHNLMAEVVVQSGKERDGKDFQGYIIRYNRNGSIDTLNYQSGYRAMSGNTFFEEDGYIWKIDTKGVKSKHSNHKFEWVQSIYVDNDDTAYLPDKGKGNGILIKLDKNGNSSIIARDLISHLDRPRDIHQDCILGMTIGCDGSVYLAETAGQRIIKILDNQKIETFYKSADNWYPSGVDFFAGDAYILEYKKNGNSKGPRIIKVDEKGNSSIIYSFDE